MYIVLADSFMRSATVKAGILNFVSPEAHPTTMKTPVNTFKQALLNQQVQIGLWVDLADGLCAELVAGIGYDWLLLDGEHGPSDLRTMLAQLQGVSSALGSIPGLVTHPIARVPVGEVVIIKQFLDLGVQTLLVPMVDTAEQAAQMVRAMRYPPDGIRGMGSPVARSSRWQGYPDYIHEANEQVCLLVQVETVEAMRNLDAIAATPGVDGVFIGPADLSASMGFPGNPGHPEVQVAIADSIARILKVGKAPGIIATTEEQARKWLAAGALFVAVGVDTMLLSDAARNLLARFKSSVPRLSAGGY